MSGIAPKRTCATTRQDVGDGDAIGEIAGIVKSHSGSKHYCCQWSNRTIESPI